MTTDERKMLADLADKFAQTPTPPKDPEAEDFIRSRIGSRPDALYLMTQTVLIQNLALQQAQQQLQDLQSRSGQSAGSGSFLGAQPPARPSGYASSGYSQPGAGQGYSVPPPQYAPSASAPPSPATGAPSFLRGAAQTAAGVAAGALAFEGIQALFSHPGYGGGGSGFGGFGGGGFGAPPVGETIVNNYYDNPSGSREDVPATFDDQGQQFADPDQLNDASYDANDNSSLDDASLSDDGGGFDDGGGDSYS